MAAVNFTAEQIDVDDLLEYLKSGRYIDCGELEEDKIERVRMIASLGFQMGSWFDEIDEDGVPWRYLYLDNDEDDEEYHGEIHMIGDLYDEGQSENSIRFEEIPMRFPADTPDVEPPDITELYDWMK